MKQAFVNVDLDFFTKPYYIGHFYETDEQTSTTHFRSQAKKWMRSEDFLSYLPVDDKVRGSFVKEDKQVIANIRNMYDTKYLKDFDYIHIDAHHDCYIWDSLENYESRSMSGFQNHDWILYLMREKIVDNIIWVAPDYVSAQPPENIPFDGKIEKISWSDFSFNEYDVKYLNVTRNDHMTIINQGVLEDFGNIMSIW